MNESLVGRYVRFGAGVAATLYFFSAAITPGEHTFFDSVDLVIHEAGHAIASFLPLFPKIAMGTIFQIFIPILFAAYFFKARQRFAGGVTLFWAGQSIVNASVYAKDAIAQSLPLLGGEAVIHDWNYMLSELGVLHQAPLIGSSIYAVGLIVLTAAAAISLASAFPAVSRDPLIYAGVIVRRENDILLVQDKREEARGLWSIPMGLVQQKEDVREVARRVAAESTGVVVGMSGVPIVLAMTGEEIKTPPEYEQNPVSLFIFSGTSIGGGLREGKDILTAKWVPLSEAMKLPFRGEWIRLLIGTEQAVEPTSDQKKPAEAPPPIRSSVEGGVVDGKGVPGHA